jgi:hypothetical protein
MPTIEIASVNSSGLDLNQEDFEVAIIEENKLESHRGLFYDFLIKQQGTIIHIGNPDMKNVKDGGYFAGDIIDWDFDSETKFQFRTEYIKDLNRILQIAFEKSPDHKVYFLTDYQFGREKSNLTEVYNLTDFWKEHDSYGLNLNTLYEMKNK